MTRHDRKAIARLANVLERRMTGEVRAVRVAVLLLARLSLEQEAEIGKPSLRRGLVKGAKVVGALLHRAELRAVLGHPPEVPGEAKRR